MPNRTFHNVFNALLFGFSGNKIHEYMDRASKTLRQKHRQVGHDMSALMEMINIFSDEYTPIQIFQTWLFHIRLDKWFDGLKAVVKKENKNYGKKPPEIEEFFKLKKKVINLIKNKKMRG